MSRTEISSRSASRRQLIKASLFGAVGVATGAIVPAVMAQPKGNTANDIKVLNNALFYEHQAIWAYGFAAGKLTDSNVGKAARVRVPGIPSPSQALFTGRGSLGAISK